MRDTIFAVATAAGRAAVAVVRMSGLDAEGVATTLCGALPPPRHAGLKRLKAGAEVLDEALVLWMPGPASFTGEDCVEFHTHGGAAVVEAVCGALHAAGVRLADPGEFTRRAFESGRLDLTQAEAIADLIDAETDVQRRQAQAQYAGALSARCLSWRETLLDASAMIEAAIDFPEDDVPDGVSSRAIPLLQAVRDDLLLTVSDSRGERVRSGLRVAIVGPPNVGKSSLLNALADRDAAIVTAIPGTTRDVVEIPVRIEGQIVILADTAGLRETTDPVEAEGVARARRWAAQADLRIVVADAARPETHAAVAALAQHGDLRVLNKTDLCDPTSLEMPPQAVGASVVRGEVHTVRAALARRVVEMTTGRDFPGITRARHRDRLTECLGHVTRALKAVDQGAELMGEDVRLATRSLERLTGQANPDAVLDRVFSTFCIGK